MFALLLLIVVPICSFHINYTYAEDVGKFWILSKVDSTLTCKQQCKEAFTGEKYICNNHVPSHYSALLKDLGFQCRSNVAARTCSWQNNNQLILSSVIKNNFRNCYLPSISQYDCNKPVPQTKCFAQNHNLLCGCEKQIKQTKQTTAPPKSIFVIPSALPTSGCNDTNGGCDPLTTCNDTMSGPICGPCPSPGFNGTGVTGCEQVDQCSSSPCQNTSCTNNNLTTYNFTAANVCVCVGNACIYIDSIEGGISGANGQYICSHYTTFTTQSWTQTLCDNYVQVGGSFNLSLSANAINSVQDGCYFTQRWDFVDMSIASIIYHTLNMPQTGVNSSIGSTGIWPLPGQQLPFLLPTCTTNNGCTAVINCGPNSICALAPRTCLNATTGTYLLHDPTSASNTSCPRTSLRVTTTPCQNPQNVGQYCITVENAALFEQNGQYVCINAGSQGCGVFHGVHNYTIALSIQLAPTIPPLQCQDSFIWRLSNGTSITSANVSDPRNGPDNAGSYTPYNITFRTCAQSYTCAACPAGSQQQDFQNCVDINECTSGYYRYPCQYNAICTNLNPGYNCSCAPQTTAVQQYCVTNQALSTTIVRARNVNSSDNTPFPIVLAGSGAFLRMDIYNGTNRSIILATSPAIDGIGSVGVGPTATIRFYYGTGNFTMFTRFLTTPTPLHGIGQQSVQFRPGDDIFITLYYVRRSIFSNSNERVLVLTWQSQESIGPTADVNLDMYLQKFNPLADSVPHYGCIAACCLASYAATPCGTVVMNDGTTSDTVEQANIQDIEKVTIAGAYYGYLVYVGVRAGQSVAQLPRSNAQFEVFSQAGNRVPDLRWAMSPPSFVLGDLYWVVGCLTPPLAGSIWNYTQINVLTFLLPTASNYC